MAIGTSSFNYQTAPTKFVGHMVNAVAVCFSTFPLASHRTFSSEPITQPAVVYVAVTKRAVAVHST